VDSELTVGADSYGDAPASCGRQRLVQRVEGAARSRWGHELVKKVAGIVVGEDSSGFARRRSAEAITGGGWPEEQEIGRTEHQNGISKVWRTW
jgi:hypothetical protein